jgi:hypothetical protein
MVPRDRRMTGKKLGQQLIDLVEIREARPLGVRLRDMLHVIQAGKVQRKNRGQSRRPTSVLLSKGCERMDRFPQGVLIDRVTVIGLVIPQGIEVPRPHSPASPCGE